MTGADIVGLGGADATSWGIDEHATHQDPEGANCELFVEGIPDSVLEIYGIASLELLSACRRRLTVANRRGWCGNSLGVEACPDVAPGSVDACEQLNFEQGLDDCAP